MEDTGFGKDLSFGRKSEVLVAEHLKKKKEIGYELAPDKCFPDWDIRFTDGETYEVKTDRIVFDTGNVAIELAYEKKKSGLLASKADKWAFAIHRCLVIVSRETLLKLLNEELEAHRQMFPKRTEFKRIGFMNR